MTAETEFTLLYERMTPGERQEVLTKLGELFGHPYRPYTSDEWLEAWSMTGETDARYEIT